jgi:hypothetical protein
MSEGEGGNFGLWRPERGGKDEPFKDVRRGGGGYFRFPPWVGGMDLIWNDPITYAFLKIKSLFNAWLIDLID